MKLSAQIVVTEDPEKIMRLFGPEMKDLSQPRSSVLMTQAGKKLVFQITAEDSTALRATLNSITKLLTVYENAGGLQ